MVCVQKLESRNSRGSIDREDGALQGPVSSHSSAYFSNIFCTVNTEMLDVFSCLSPEAVRSKALKNFKNGFMPDKRRFSHSGRQPVTSGSDVHF